MSLAGNGERVLIGLVCVGVVMGVLILTRGGQSIATLEFILGGLAIFSGRVAWMKHSETEVAYASRILPLRRGDV
jgi:hypothetical protein